MNQSNIVIARFANGGIGDHLSCLIGSWWFAKQTGRTLVIDWRGSRFNSDHTFTKNCFTDFFCQCNNLAGVRTISDDSVSNIHYMAPYFPSKWNAENLAGTEHIGHSTEEIQQVNEAVRLGMDIPELTAAFNQWISPGPPQNEVKLLLNELHFSESIRAAAIEIWAEKIGNKNAIAIHIRHGNGENIGLRASYWLSPYRLFKQLKLNRSVNVHGAGASGRFGDNMPDSHIQTEKFSGSELHFLRRIKIEVEKMQRRIPDSKIILFCDSNPVALTIQRMVPNVVVPPKIFLEANGGPLHSIKMSQSGDHEAVSRISFEMAVDMELMRRCSALICMDSGFSIFSKALLTADKKIFLKPPLLNMAVEKLINKIF